MPRPRACARLAWALTAIGIAATPVRAVACASCGCGDPTLTAVGVEKPYQNRLRIAVEERVGARSSGRDVALARQLVLRSQLGVSYSPHARVTLVAVLPLVASSVHGPAGRAARIVGLGDLDLQARVVVARDRAFSPRHLFWLSAGLKTPTAPRVRDDAGFPYPDDEQPGSGSWDPSAGATYAWFGDLVSVSSTLLYRHPTSGPRGYRFGPSLLSSTVAQLQPFTRVAFQLGADLRYAFADELANGAAAPSTGGLVAGVVPGLLVNPWRDLLLRAAVEVPVYQALRGAQSVGPQGVFTVSYDFL